MSYPNSVMRKLQHFFVIEVNSVGQPSLVVVPAAVEQIGEWADVELLDGEVVFRYRFAAVRVQADPEFLCQSGTIFQERLRAGGGSTGSHNDLPIASGRTIVLRLDQRFRVSQNNVFLLQGPLGNEIGLLVHGTAAGVETDPHFRGGLELLECHLFGSLGENIVMISDGSRSAQHELGDS